MELKEMQKIYKATYLLSKVNLKKTLPIYGIFV